MKKLLLSALSATALMGVVSVQAQNTINIIGTVWSLDTLYHAKVGPGTTQTHLELVSPSGSKLQVFYLTVDKTTPGVSMRAVCATDKVAGTERPSTMAKRKSGNGVLYFAGTNGDFYSTSGTATNGSSKVGSPTTGCTADRETYKTSNGNYQFSVDTAGVARVSRLYYYTGTATLGEKTTLFKGINVASPNNGITIYTPKYWGSTNQTDKADACAEVTAKLVEGDKMYAGCKFRLEVTSTATTDGDTTIPSDGYVIHGRGKSTSGGVTTGALSFVSGLQVGDIIEFDNVVLSQQEGGERIVPAQIVSGNPKNVGEGLTLDTEGERTDAVQLHPRTGIGVSQSGDSIIMMVVDGRSLISAGVRTSQLADIMRYAGAWEAVNLDGGGSSCLYTSAFGVRNVGSDGSERSVGNGIFATITAPDDNEIAEIQFVDWVKNLPKYGHYTPKFYGYNKYGVLVNTDLQGVTLSCPAELGEVVDNGSSLYGKGAGTHALTATYNGVTTSIAVTVDAAAEPTFRHAQVLLDSYKDYTVDAYGVVGDTDEPLYNTAFSWESADITVATVDENGVINGLKDGKTTVKGTIDGYSSELDVLVEIPTVHYQSIDKGLDVSTWKFDGKNIENYAISACGKDGIALDYTTTAARSVSLNLKKDITSWSRPDSLLIDINPGTATIKNFYFYFKDYRDPENLIEYQYTPSLTTEADNRILIKMNEIVDIDDMSTYPLVVDSISIVPGNPKGTTHHIEMSRIAWVYNAVPAGSSAIENVNVAVSGDLVLTPNPVVAGTAVKMNVAEPVKYTVSALNGSVAKQGEGVEISTEGLASGVYLVSVIKDEKTVVAKLLVK